ncbi:MAG: YlxR family protein [Candidatus Izemoplasma sp.]
MKERKLPLRKCVVTNERLLKSELVRIVKNSDDVAVIDLTGKVNGRGAYLQMKVSVVEKAKKTRALERHLGIKIDESIYTDLIEMINNGQ